MFRTGNPIVAALLVSSCLTGIASVADATTITTINPGDTIDVTMTLSTTDVNEGGEGRTHSSNS